MLDEAQFFRGKTLRVGIVSMLVKMAREQIGNDYGDGYGYGYGYGNRNPNAHCRQLKTAGLPAPLSTPS